MRQAAAAKDHRFGPDETVFPDFDRLGGLATDNQIDAVSDELRTKPGDGSERADANTRGAID